MGLHCIAASPWLAQLLHDRYQTSAAHFDLGVDHSVYRPQPHDRRENLVIFYARAATSRRAVPLGLTALAELAARRPSVQIELFGEDRGISRAGWPAPSSPCGHMGVLPETELAALYSRATVGLVFSLTNPSLIGPEMMACGLPCVELATPSMTSTFGSNGPLQLVEPDPLALCARIERLLDDSKLRGRLSSEGLHLTATRSWQRAAEQIEAALRNALEDELRNDR
jgi:glycosyltransferase involved in cell wall biosynthesis